MFVVESQRVQQLVLDDAVVDAAEALQRHHLLIPNAANGGETPGGGKGGGEGPTEGVPLHRYARVSPVSRLKAQVHPLILSRLEADAGLAVEILHGRHNVVLLLIICTVEAVGRHEGAEEETLPLDAPPTVFIADSVGDPHFPIRRFGPQAVKSFIQAFHGVPGFGNVQISLQEELAGPFWRKIDASVSRICRQKGKNLLI